MSQPGSIFHCVPPRVNEPARAHRDLQRQVQMNAAAQTGQAMQIGAGGILVNGGGGITIQGSGSFNIGSGTLNAAGAITTTQGVTAAGAVESGNGAAVMDGSGNITSASVSTGPVTASNVIASGQVESNGSPFKSLPSYNYVVHIGPWQVAYIDSDGSIGRSSSSALVKTALVPMTAADAQKLLGLTPYWGRYVWDDPTVPPRVFFLAEDVQAAGFGPDVAPTTDAPMTLVMPDGSPILDSAGAPCVIPAGGAFSVNYPQLVVPLLNAVKTQQAQVALLQAQVQQLATAAGITLTETA